MDRIIINSMLNYFNRVGSQIPLKPPAKPKKTQLQVTLKKLNDLSKGSIKGGAKLH